MHTSEDTDAAVEKLNGIETEWGSLRVGHAKGTQYRKQTREGDEDGGVDRREVNERRERIESKSSWR